MGRAVEGPPSGLHKERLLALRGLWVMDRERWGSRGPDWPKRKADAGPRPLPPSQGHSRGLGSGSLRAGATVAPEGCFSRPGRVRVGGVSSLALVPEDAC